MLRFIMEASVVTGEEMKKGSSKEDKIAGVLAKVLYLLQENKDNGRFCDVIYLCEKCATEVKVWTVNGRAIIKAEYLDSNETKGEKCLIHGGHWVERG